MKKKICYYTTLLPDGTRSHEDFSTNKDVWTSFANNRITRFLFLMKFWPYFSTTNPRLLAVQHKPLLKEEGFFWDRNSKLEFLLFKFRSLLVRKSVGAHVGPEKDKQTKKQTACHRNRTDRSVSHLAVVCGKDDNASRARGHGAGEVLFILP